MTRVGAGWGGGGSGRGLSYRYRCPTYSFSRQGALGRDRRPTKPLGERSLFH